MLVKDHHMQRQLREEKNMGKREGKERKIKKAGRDGKGDNRRSELNMKICKESNRMKKYSIERG